MAAKKRQMRMLSGYANPGEVLPITE